MKKLTKCEKCYFGYFSDKEHRCKKFRKQKKILVDEFGEEIKPSMKKQRS